MTVPTEKSKLEHKHNHNHEKRRGTEQWLKNLKVVQQYILTFQNLIFYPGTLCMVSTSIPRPKSSSGFRIFKERRTSRTLIFSHSKLRESFWNSIIHQTAVSKFKNLNFRNLWLLACLKCCMFHSIFVHADDVVWFLAKIWLGLICPVSYNSISLQRFLCLKQRHNAALQTEQGF